MTHELRTPLAGLIGLTTILAESRTESERQELTASIGQCASSLLSLVDDILDVARIEAGRTVANNAPCAPGEAIEEVISMLRRTAAEKGVQLAAIYESPLPALVTTDGALLRRIVLNLTGNALKFTAAGSVTIWASYEAPTLALSVTDTGCGIPAADLPHLMEQFYQASNTTSASRRGTGLGLHLSRQWVRLLGGNGLEVRSELGTGSSFSFAIPAPEASPPPVPAALAAEVLPRPALRILVAEDNPVNQRVLVRLLEKLGHQPLLAADGHEAVAQWRREAPDLILMDYRMPGQDGLEATREIRGLEGTRSRVPIIAVTANALTEHRDGCLAAGMDDYLAKPVTLQQLAASIDRWRGPALA